jgi:hypothetical protein
VVVRACNSSTWEAEAGSPQVFSYFKVQESKTLKEMDSRINECMILDGAKLLKGNF